MISVAGPSLRTLRLGHAHQRRAPNLGAAVAHTAYEPAGARQGDRYRRRPTAVVIKTDQLTRFYGIERGVERLRLEVRRGEVFGFLGPNRVGKIETVTQQPLTVECRGERCNSATVRYLPRRFTVSARRRVGGPRFRESGTDRRVSFRSDVLRTAGLQRRLPGRGPGHGSPYHRRSG